MVAVTFVTKPRANKGYHRIYRRKGEYLLAPFHHPSRSIVILSGSCNVHSPCLTTTKLNLCCHDHSFIYPRGSSFPPSPLLVDKLWHVYEFVMDEMFPQSQSQSALCAFADSRVSACNKHNSFLWANKEHNNNTKPAFNAEEHNLWLSRQHL